MIRNPLTFGLEYTREAYDARIRNLWERIAIRRTDHLGGDQTAIEASFEFADKWIKEYSKRVPRP
jgi:hypothetical protein